MNFEWDENKNEINKNKHSIDFEIASQVFNDQNRIDIPSERNGEDRRLTIGKVVVKLYAVAYTMRSTVVRIISARRANKKEENSHNSQL